MHNILRLKTPEGRFVAVNPIHVSIIGEAIAPPPAGLPQQLVPKVMGTMLILTCGSQMAVEGKPDEIAQMIEAALNPFNGTARIG